MSIFDSLGGGLKALKNSVVEGVALNWINRRIETFGEIKNLKLDPGERTVSFEAVLKGESEPFRVNRARYELSKEEGKTFIQFTEVDCSREWINLAFQEFFKDRKFEVPDAVHAALA